MTLKEAAELLGAQEELPNKTRCKCVMTACRCSLGRRTGRGARRCEGCDAGIHKGHPRTEPVTLKEAAELLGVSPDTLRVQVRNGSWPRGRWAATGTSRPRKSSGIASRTGGRCDYQSASPLLPRTCGCRCSDGEPMRVTVQDDALVERAVQPFDYEFTGTSEFVPAFETSQLPDDFGIGVIVGASGSGKSTMLREFGEASTPQWLAQRAIAGHFESAEDARQRFAAVALNAVPTWGKPYHVLSNGERFRADLARVLDDWAVVDEFTSVVDRTVAASVSNAVRRYVSEQGIRHVVIASCHRDILPWLMPDWVIDLDTRGWSLRPRECLQRPNLVVEVYAGTTEAWRVFRRHHYLTGTIATGARCFVAVVNGGAGRLRLVHRVSQRLSSQRMARASNGCAAGFPRARYRYAIVRLRWGAPCQGRQAVLFAYRSSKDERLPWRVFVVASGGTLGREAR